MADGHGQQIWSPYAAMGNAPESMVDPNGESAYVSMGQNMMSQMNTMGTLGAMFGADNFTVDAFGKIGIVDMKAAWTSLLSFMSGGTGGGCAASTYTMGSIGLNILMNINNPNYNTFMGFAGNNFMAHESGSDLLLGSRLMAGNLPKPSSMPGTPINETEFGITLTETYFNLSPGINVLNFGSKMIDGRNLAGDYVGHPNALEAVGPPVGRVARVATEVGSEMTTVGRWMSQGEYAAMKNGTRVLEGAGGQTFVTQGGSHLFSGAARGSIYAEFQVPANSLLQGGKQGWFKMLGPNASKSQQYLLQKQDGTLLPQYQNLSPILEIK